MKDAFSFVFRHSAVQAVQASTHESQMNLGQDQSDLTLIE
jgi:hypothetical protein